MKLKKRILNRYFYKPKICAHTGGSTTNYITQMMTIGLVSKTPNKRSGGAVIYKINDPKVSYAIKHDILNHRFKMS